MLRNKQFLACHSQWGKFAPFQISPLSNQSCQFPLPVGTVLRREDDLLSQAAEDISLFWEAPEPPISGTWRVAEAKLNLGYRFHSSFSTLISMNEFKSGQQVLGGWSKDGETGPFSSPPSSSSSWKLGL